MTVEKTDPIKPKQLINKKPNFKKEKLDDEFIKVSLAGLYGQFRSPGVFTRETDIGQWDVSQVTDMSTMFTQDIFIPQREEPIINDGTNDNGRIYNINVGELDHADVDHFIRRMREALRVPPQYLGNQETDVVGVEQMRTQQEVENLYGQLGHPIGISSRQRQNTDGSLDLLGYDLVAPPATPRGRLLPLTAQGGEQMVYEASSFMTLHKKKTRWGRLKENILNIYRKWKRAE